MNFDDLFYYLNYGRTRKQKKRDLMFLRTLFFIQLITVIIAVIVIAICIKRRTKEIKMPHAVLELPHRANITTNHSLAVRKL